MLDDVQSIVMHHGDWILSGVLVFLFAWNRFNTPARFAASTTVWRFRRAAFSYCGSALLAFVLVAYVIEGTPQLVPSITNTDVNWEQVSAPILAALLLTTALPHTPWLKTVDDALLRFFREMGNIPGEVRHWRDRLKRSNPSVTEELRKQVIDMANTDPRLITVREEDLRFKADDSAQYAYTRVLILLNQIERLGADRAYLGVVETFGEEYRLIRAKFEEVTVQAFRCFALSESDGAAGSGGATISPVHECRAHLQQRCQDLYTLMCEFVAYAILKCGRRKADRREKLVQLGLPSVEDEIRSINPDLVVGVWFAMFVILIAGLSFFSGNIDANSSNIHAKKVLTAIMVSTIYGVSIFCAVLPKSWWPMPHAGSSAAPPVRIYLLSGVLAMVAGVLIALVFKTLWMQDFHKAITDQLWKWPWTFMSFAMALTIAVLCDNRWYRGPEPFWLRCVEGLVTSAVLAATALLVCDIFADLSTREGAPPNLGRFTWERILPLSAAIGFVAGASVPHFYRRAHRREEENAGGRQSISSAADASLQGERGAGMV